MFKGLSPEVFENELPGDAPIWFVHQKNSNSIIFTPDENGENITYLFLKQEDAEHFALLLNKLAPILHDIELEVVGALKKDIIEQFVKHEIVFAAIPPTEAIKFFQQFEEFMTDYYK